ncbi:hypothetical protein ACFV1L_10360 [Kitasatospora sp. NPDC059646]|uniref:hypothetical protein n=1 Tax=Kitasatospora sp. NPDC059646 TaxID=3346893 RepID=UPI0036B7D6AD
MKPATRIRRFRQETRYPHQRSDGLTTRRSNGGTRELIITQVPGRKGSWLVTADGSALRVLAKFRNDEATEEFRLWVRDNDGRTLWLEDGE